METIATTSQLIAGIKANLKLADAKRHYGQDTAVIEASNSSMCATLLSRRVMVNGWEYRITDTVFGKTMPTIYANLIGIASTAPDLGDWYKL